MSKKLKKNVPELRFSEFEGNWTLNKLGNISSLSSGATPLRSNSSYFENATIPWVKTTDLNNSEIIKTEECISEIAIKETSARKNPIGSVLIAMYGGFNQIGRTGLLKIEAATNQAITVVFPKSVIDSFFLQHLLNRNVDEWRSFAASSRKDPNITSKDIGSFLIVFPSIAEQEKIASFLGLIDSRLTQLRRKHELLQTYKRGVIQKVFSQEFRFKRDNSKSFLDWETNRIDNFLVRYSSPVDVQLDAEYSQIGIRSHGKGIFHKEPVTGRALGNKRVYWVHPKSFVINIVFAWERAVALTSIEEDDFIASHRFLMFLPKNNKVNLKFILLFFLSNRGKSLLELASPGGAGRNKTLGQHNFSELLVTFPSLEEQEKIASFLTAIDTKIQAVAQQIDRTEQFKKGLLQKMFV